MEREITFGKYRVSHTDLVRFWVILSLAVSCILITAIALARNVETIYPQLFYFPILYATYFYPRRGILVAGICAIAYECLVYVFLFPDTLSLWSATGQAILFICVATAIAYFIEKVQVSEARYRSIFDNSLLGIVLFDKNSFAIQLTNQQFGAMLGYTAEELTHMPFSALLFDHGAQRRFFELLGSSEDIRNFETCFVTRDGKPSRVNLSWSRISGSTVSCSVIDINERELARKEADDTAAQYRQLTESSPTAIVITGDKKIVFSNPAFSAFSGYGPEECTGRDLADFVLPDDREAFLAFSRQWESADPVASRAEFRFFAKDQKTRRGVLFFTPIIRNGKAACLINIVDNTEWEEFREHVEQTNERRRDIISTVAHDLRTPLQPIMGYLNLLMQDPQAFGVTEETRQILERCVKSVDRERQIINQMLELSVLDAGETELNYSIFSVPELVRSIVEEGGYAVKAEIHTDLPADLTFDADREKIAMTIDAMLTNGVTYSKPPRKIWITYRSEPSHPFHRLAIRDNGVGITDARLDEIFEPAGSPDQGKQNRNYERTGLSLSIAKKYIQLHGGYISVDSIVNIGSTFTIHLPKKRPKGGEHV
jgi:PAS domain S-box-containing protein